VTGFAAPVNFFNPRQMPPNPNPDSPMRKDVRRIAVLIAAGGVLEAAITGRIVDGVLIILLGSVALLAAHHWR